MKPQITLITLGVDDLPRSVRFYHEGLGFPTQGIIGTESAHGAVAFFDLNHGLKLALYARSDIAWDAGIPETPRSPTEMTIAHNVAVKEEVDQLMKLAENAGATITKPAEKKFWGGYGGYFQDPDGHLWEIVWNPQLLPEE
jgi:predicted lactoylglutathione lyase